MTGFGEWMRGLFGARGVARPDASLGYVPAAPESSGEFAADHNDFALALYRELGRGTGNLFFSPFSVRTCLAMAYAGARGETAAQMGKTLRVAASDEALHRAFAAATHGLNARAAGSFELALAASLWAQDGAPILEEFLGIIMRHYGGALSVVDFRRRPDDARVAINAWVEEQTRRRICGLIPRGGVQADTRLVLANAAWLKAAWERPFDREITRDEPFFVKGAGEVQVPLMRTRDDVRYGEAMGCQAVDLEYRRGRLSMLVLLPRERDGLRNLEARIAAGRLLALTSKMVPRKVQIALPRFRMTWGTADLRDPLGALGMPLAFTRFKADFSGLTGLDPSHDDAVFLSGVHHKAFVEVNEEGTEAGAATATVGPATAALHRRAPRYVEFRADHPFLFAIREPESGVILFLGRVADPTKES